MTLSTPLTAALPLIAMTLLLASCDATVTGPPVSVERPVAGFDRIEISNGFDVEVRLDSVEGMTIEAPEGAIPRILSSVVGRTLHVELDDDVNGNFSPKKLVIRTTGLRGIALSGGCRLTATGTFRPQELGLEMSGGSSIAMAIAVERLDINSSGGSSATLVGSAGAVDAEVSGGGAVRAFELGASSVTVGASGGSRLDVRASDRLVVAASGGSTIAYKGRPAVTSDLSGGSKVIDAN